MGPWFRGVSSSAKPLEQSVLLTLWSAAPSEEMQPLVKLYARTLYPAAENDVKDCINPPPVLRHNPFPQTAPIVRTQFVTTHNNVGFVRKKAQTISFIERGFERLNLGHKTVVFRPSPPLGEKLLGRTRFNYVWTPRKTTILWPRPSFLNPRFINDII